MTQKVKEAVILIGHGAPASDTPRELVEKLKRMEAQRNAQKITAMSEHEAEMDRQVREWPRTQENDPYKVGLEDIADKLRPKLGGKTLTLAYNEFCFPSVEQEIAGLVAEGFTHITLTTTMYTRGGIHSEIEIPQIVAESRKKYPKVNIDYAWPFDTESIASFLATHLKAPIQPKSDPDPKNSLKS